MTWTKASTVMRFTVFNLSAAPANDEYFYLAPTAAELPK